MVTVLIVLGIIVALPVAAWLFLMMPVSVTASDAAVERAERAEGQAQERSDAQARIVCPHCQTAGHVTTMLAKRRRRLSATRVISAGVTLGASLPMAGTSKKNVVTEMNCSNCGMKWDVV